MPDRLLLMLGVLAAAAAGLWAWRRWHHRPLWLCLGYPRAALAVRLTWRKVALDCAGSPTSSTGSAKLLHRDTTKTENSTASLPLFGLCVSALRDRQRIQEEARQDAGARWKDSDLVFTTKNGTPVEPRNFYRSFERYCERAGVPQIRVHDTRHTCASLLAALDVHPRVAMRILRHSQISVTMNVYTQVPSPATRMALDRLNSSFEGN